MLQSLQIKNFAIIDNLNVNFLSGMSAMTGETGAGKSILIDALNLVLGGRGDVTVIRHGCDKTTISASFDVTENQDVMDFLKKYDLDDGTDCILRRVISADKKSRSYVNDIPTRVQKLKEFASLILDIHGQHEHHSLSNPISQLRILDAHLDAPNLIKSINETYNLWQDTKKELHKQLDLSDKNSNIILALKTDIGEIEKLNLKKEELKSIEQEYLQLANADNLISHSNYLLDSFYNKENSILSVLNKATNSIQQIRQIDKNSFDDDFNFDNLIIEIEEAVREIKNYHNRLEIDPKRLIYIENHLREIEAIAKHHQCDSGDILNILSQKKEQLKQIDNSLQLIEELTEKTDKLKENYFLQAEKLHQKRVIAIDNLCPKISKIMEQLSMVGGRFIIEIEKITDDKATAYGIDKILFKVSTNYGMPPTDLRKTASGGELSRISLSIALVLANKKSTPTMIFDEVDSGIGGEVANTVGKYLQKLSENVQVLCVTHLPQVASFADSHYRVSKNTKNELTTTKINLLDESARITEITRMLSGDKQTDSAVVHAKEFLEQSKRGAKHIMS
ncbi:MAG: DNA repair protein RecN [Gammaproteobacteria bacterium]|nr:MAG: DNA repair protein RecN [Gammaproteobacteria bacterium]